MVWPLKVLKNTLKLFFLKLLCPCSILQTWPWVCEDLVWKSRWIPPHDTGLVQARCSQPSSALWRIWVQASPFSLLLSFILFSKIILSPPRAASYRGQRWTTLGREWRTNNLSIFTYIFVYICGCTFRITCACVYERMYIDPCTSLKERLWTCTLFLTKTNHIFFKYDVNGQIYVNVFIAGNTWDAMGVEFVKWQIR